MSPKMLSSGSPIPLYYQVQEFLRGEIEEGKLRPGDALPTEADLAEQFGVSRITVREALRALVERGLIQKRKGVGSFVTNAKIDEILPGLNSFSTEMRARGYTVTSQVLELGFIVPSGRILSILKLPAGREVVHVVRLRSINGEPFLISTSYLPRKVTLDEDFTGSIYELLEEKYGFTIASGQTSIEAGLADEREAQLLELEVRDAVLRITWLAITDKGIPIEYSEATYPGDRYRYVIQLQR